MVEWSIEALRECRTVGSIVVACPPGPEGEPEPGPLRGSDRADLRLVPGGAARAQSVANALEAVETELVAIHDAARPLLSAELFEGVVALLEDDPEAAGAIAAAPLTDTIKRVGGTSATSDRYERANAALVIESTEDRSKLWAAQTPQVFRTAALAAALDVAPGVRDAATDEATLVEAAGGRVLIYPSAPGNLKVTTPTDLRLAELLLERR